MTVLIDWKSKLMWSLTPKSVKKEYQQLLEDNVYLTERVTEQSVYISELLIDANESSKHLKETEAKLHWAEEQNTDLKYQVEELLKELSELEEEVDGLTQQIQELASQVEGY